jgi:ubiquinone/menaquinone biosynthesis C-methylase UbiE
MSLPKKDSRLLASIAAMQLGNKIKEISNSEIYLLRMNGGNDNPSLSDVPSKAASYYDRNAQSYSDSNQHPAEFIDEFLEYLQKDNGKVILDLGSGPGINAAYIYSKNFQVVGIDLSEKMVEYAKSKYPQIEFRLGDMTKLSFPSNRFDGILASYSLIHLTKDSIPCVMAKLSEILKPGGIMYISIQSGESTQGYYSHPLIPSDQVFLNIFSKKEVSSLLSANGFEIVSQHEKLPQGKVFNFTKLFIIAKKLPPFR